MNVSRHHADWLSLVEVSGPFISMPVLLRVFPQGLEPRDPVQAKALRAAYEEWQDNPTAPGKQRAWVQHVLTAVLGYPQGQIAEGQTLPAGLEANMPEMGETLRPDFALVGPAGSDTAGQAQILIASYLAEQSLDKPVTGKHWKATAATRMMELLHGAGVPLGLITNGEHWMLVYAPPGETTGYASWYSTLWLDEPITLCAFHSLLGVRRFFGVDADNTLLALLKESASDQQEVTDQLGYQVREAVEVLVQSFDALDKESKRILLKDVSPSVLYDAALTTMMRLVFLFSAEERGLLHLGKPLYDNNYAVSTLQEQLQEVADHYGEEVLERRYDAWARLLATFRAVHDGIKHQDLLMLAYGGSLFDPDRYPFLEGRAAGSSWRSTPAEPLAVNNRVVLHLLNSLQRLRTKVGAGVTTETRRISFRALGVEQIGHVYEGLLDHTAVRASEPVLGIKGTRSKEPEIAITTLESLLGQGQDKLIDYLKDETGRTTTSPIKRALAEGGLLDEHKLLIACNQDETLLARIRPFVGLIREDSFERPLVVLAGSVYVTAGSTRRSTGTHYTPPSLTEPIVKHALEPIVYEGPAEGLPREKWKLRLPKEILDLKVCDMAMGSGAFLVQACRYLAERLVESWENEEKRHPDQVLITPDGKFSAGLPSERLVPADANERVAVARRVVADRCLYGVDINPMAVEMAKLSLWLITVSRDRSFTFLDHAFKCGDSLLGITSLEQLENFSLRSDAGKQQAFATLNLRRSIEEAKKKREMLETMLSDTPEQISAKAALYAEAEESVAMLSAAADVLIAVELKGLKAKDYEIERAAIAHQMMENWAIGRGELQAFASKMLVGRRCFHWALAFPEIIAAGGFNAFLGNPPYLGGSRITSYFGETYSDYLLSSFASANGNADYCTYFLRRAYNLLRESGDLGFVVTHSISRGDSRESGLSYLINNEGAVLFRAEVDRPWPGAISQLIHHIHLTSGLWNGEIFRNGAAVPALSSSLDADEELPGCYELMANIGLCLGGSELRGDFYISEQEAASLIKEEPQSESVIKPFLSGNDITSRFDLSPSRLVIDFRTMKLEEAEKYPLALKLVREKVYPDRKNDKRAQRRNHWWLHGETAPALYRQMETKSLVLVVPRTSVHMPFVVVPSDLVIANSCNVFLGHSYAWMAVLSSSIHSSWVRLFCSTRETRQVYTIERGFNTFLLPEQTSSKELMLEEIGKGLEHVRGSIANIRGCALTDMYNVYHVPTDHSEDMQGLRNVHIKLDNAVASAYGWHGLDLGHGFHETKQGIRFTISEAARREVLDRLLALNHQRYAEEVASGLHEKKAEKTRGASGKRSRKKKNSDDQLIMDH